MVTLLLLVFQIIIESLPISSSGHINLLRLLLEKLGYSAPLLMDVTFRNLSNAPTLIVFVFYFFKHWIMLLRMLKRNMRILFKFIFFLASGTLVTLLTCFITSLLLLSLSCIAKVSFSYFYAFLSAAGFLITGLLLFSLKYIPQERYEGLTYKKVIIIGFFQGVAFLPGISRLGITYTIGRWLKLRPYKSFIFSCALEVPLLIGGFIQTILITLLMDQEPVYKIIYGPIFTHSFSFFIFITALLLAYILLAVVEYLVKKELLWKMSFYMVIPFLLACLL